MPAGAGGGARTVEQPRPGGVGWLGTATGRMRYLRNWNRFQIFT